MSQTDIEALIHTAGGGPALPTGQAAIFPETEVPSSVGQLGLKPNADAPKSPTSTTAEPAPVSANQQMLTNLFQGKPATGEAKPAAAAPAVAHSGVAVVAAPAQSAPLPPLQPVTGLTVTDKGNGAPGHTFPTNPPLGAAPQPTAQAQAPVQANAPAATSYVGGNIEVDDFASLGDEWESLDDEPEVSPGHSAVLPPTQTQTPVTPPPPPPTAPAPAPVAVQQKAPDPAPVTETKISFKNDNELNDINTQIASIEQQVRQHRYALGIALLSDPKQREPFDWNTRKGNFLHEAIEWVRWRSIDLAAVPPQQLLQFEHVLAAAQVYVQGEEGYWAGSAHELHRPRA
jgi:hypothetical protein